MTHKWKQKFKRLARANARAGYAFIAGIAFSRELLTMEMYYALLIPMIIGATLLLIIDFYTITVCSCVINEQIKKMSELE